jgi:hypothetical protein
VKSSILNKFLGVIIAAAFVIPSAVPAFASASGNNDFDTANNLGYWKYATTSMTLEKEQLVAYYKFTVNTGEKIYVSCTYNNEYGDMSAELFDANRNPVDKAVGSKDVIIPASGTPFLPLDCNGTSNNQIFYIRVSRNSYDLKKDMYYTMSFFNRIGERHSTFKFSGTASNPGNKGTSPSGSDSSILTLDLRDLKIPKKAIVQSVTTSSTQYQKQGGTHHMLMPSQKGTWYISEATSPTNGRYSLTERENCLVAQIWKFKYNTKAAGKSEMSNVEMKVDWLYDLADNNYKLFLD